MAADLATPETINFMIRHGRGLVCVGMEAGMLANLDASLHGKTGELYYLVKVDKAKFSKTVVPGDQLVLEVIQTRILRRMGFYTCEALVDGQRVATCEILCAGK